LALTFYSDPSRPPFRPPSGNISALFQSLAQGRPENSQQLLEYFQQLAENHGDFLGYLSGSTAPAEVNGKFKVLLDQLKSKDEVKITQGVIELASELSMAQDSALSQSVLEQFIPPLIDCLKMNAFPEIVRKSLYYY